MAAHFKEWPEKPENLVLEEKEKGQGSYGRVYIGKLAGNPVAVKVIYPNLLRAPGNDHLLLGFKEECAKLQSLKHDRIVKLLGTFWDKSLGPLLVMEVLDQNLEEFLRDRSKPGGLPLMQQLEIVKEVTEGLRYLHSHNIVHRDLKPANILIGKDGHLRIGDLGQSKLLNNLSDIMKTMQPGTPLYLPPEALKKGSAYTLKIDVFSLGVVTLCIATQAAPTTDIMNIGAVPEIIRRKEDLDRLEEKHPLKGVISACLQDDPNLRPDVCFIDDHLGVLVGSGRHVNKLEESLSEQRKELMDLNKLYNLQKKELAVSKSKFKVQEIKCRSHLQTIERQTRELEAHRQALYDEREAKQQQGEEMLQKVSNLEAKLKVEMQRFQLLEKTFREETGKLKKEVQTQEFECQSHLQTIERQRKELNVQKQILDEEQKEKQLLQEEMSRRVSNLEARLKMENDNYENDMISIEETLAIQQEKLDELSKLSTDAHVRNTLLEEDVHELRKRLNTAKYQLKSEIDQMKHTPNKQKVHQSEKEPFTQKAVDMKGNASGGFHPNAGAYHQNPNMGIRVDDTSVAAQTDTTISELILTGKNVCMRAISEITLKEPDVVEIPLEKTHRRLVVKRGRFLYEDADIKIAAICSELGFTKGLNKNLNDQLKGQLLQTVNRRYQNGKPDKFNVFTVHCPPLTIGCRYLVVANILDRTLGSRQDHHKFLQQILHSVFKEADTLEMPTVAIATQSFAICEFPEDTILPSFVRTLNQYQFTNDEFFSDVRILATSAEKLSHLIAVTERFLGKSLTSRHTSSKKTTSDLPNSKYDVVHLSSQEMIEPGVVEIPLEKTHRRLVVKRGHFLYEDADIKIAAICSETGFTKGLHKNLNDQLKGQLLQTVNRRYQNGKPDKFDVFAVHCPPLTIGCRYLVVANILDRTLAKQKDHHKFLQQILHSVFKEADTLEMPTVAIATQSFAVCEFPEDTILPLFVRTLNQYQFTNDEFFSDVRILATSAEKLSHLIAVAERFLGKSLTSRHTSSKKTTSDLPYSKYDKVHLSSQEMIDKSKRRVVQPLADTSNLKADVVNLMDRCQMIDKQSLRIHSDFTRVDALEGAEQKLEEFSTSYCDLFKRQRIIQESLRVRETLPHNTLALLVSTLEEQFPRTLFSSNVDNNTLHFLSLDQTICPAVDKAIQDFLFKRTGTQRQPLYTKGITEQPTMITLPMPYNRSLTVKKGDLVEEEVTAIVNAANAWLKHGAGVAYAINWASHGQVQRESDKVIRDNSQQRIPTGKVAVTGAGGDLRCESVIHAVGPDASTRRIDDCKQLLKQACENTLLCAEDKGMHSIALPPISSKIYAMPKDLVAQILIDTILQYPYRQDSSLKDIRIVIIDQLTLMPFLQYAQQVVDSSPFVSPKASATSPSSAPVFSTSQQLSFPPPPSEPDTLDIPLEKTLRKLVLKKGHFLYEDADIKIAAICSELQFTEGLNKDLNDHLKGQLQQTVDRRYQNGKPDKFDVFTVHCPPSTIGCRYLVVANILNNTLGKQKDHHKFLQQILHSVFKKADTLEMPSVAIVPTTFAIGGFPKDIILPSFIRMFSQYQFTNDEFLTDVRFLSATDNDFSHLIASAKRAIEKIPSQPSPVTSPEGQAQESSKANQGSWPWSIVTTITNTVTSLSTVKSLNPFSTGTNPIQDESMKVDTVIPFGLNNMRSLVIKLDDLIYQEVTAIVNPANGQLKHIAGIATAIDQASNGIVQRESNHLIHRMGGPLATGRVAITKAGGSLRCEHVIHAVGPDAQAVPLEKCQELLKQVCENILQCAERHDMKSIALPAISSGFNAMPMDLVAQILIDTILRYSYKPDSSLKDIYIVINEREKIDAFLRYFHQREASRTTMSATNRTDPAYPTSGHPQPSFTKESSPVSKSEVVDVMEIPLEKIHRKLVVKKGHFLYEDADIKIAAICSEMGFTKGLNKSLNDQLKGELQQTVNRRYQNGKPDKFDVFTVHCPPPPIGCRYLVVANILDRTLGSRQDQHKFLQQILHSVFKEADTLEMPSVAILPSTFAISGSPRETILPSFIRMFSQYQFTNDDFLTDVRFLATDDVGLASLCAAAERTVGKAHSLKEKSNPATIARNLTSSPDQSPGYGSKVAKIPAVTVITGDIAQFAADAIVVPVSPSLDMKGDTSKAINSISKGAVFKYVSRLKGKLFEGNLIPIPCVEKWNIQSKYLLLLCRSQNTTLESLTLACNNALEIAKSRHLHSIAFPPITSHQRKGVLARAMMDVINDFSDENQGLLSVTIVVKKDDAIYKPFLQIMESTVSHWECKESTL